jgi:hypothetical protein
MRPSVSDAQSALESRVVTLLEANRAGLTFEQLRSMLVSSEDFLLHTSLGSLREKGWITRRVDLYVVLKASGSATPK